MTSWKAKAERGSAWLIHLIKVAYRAGDALQKRACVGFFHDFETDAGVRLAREWDCQVTRKFGKYFAGLVKYAKVDPDVASIPAVKKIWVQVEFNY